MVDNLNRVLHLLETLPVCPDTAAHVHVAVVRQLRWGGYCVIPEYAVPGGRIDVVALCEGWRVAIEIDARRPRARSLIKLRGFLGAKVVALRGVTALLPDGIDGVATIPVRTATDVERADRRTVSRVRK